MGMQNGSKQEVLILDLYLYTPVPLEYSHKFVLEAMHLQCLAIKKLRPFTNIMYMATIIWSVVLRGVNFRYFRG